MVELENALAQHAPPLQTEDPSKHELPPLVIDGIPTPVIKETILFCFELWPKNFKNSIG